MAADIPVAARHVRFRQWRVYAGAHDGRGLFVYARVFATQREMLTALRVEARAGGQRGFAHGTAGAMQSFMHFTPGGYSTPCIGRVNLYRRRLGTEIISHEFAHAMFAWADRMRLTGELHRMPVEEQACYVLGRMLRRFVNRAYALGLYSAKDFGDVK